jgi:hypothetical protein
MLKGGWRIQDVTRDTRLKREHFARFAKFAGEGGNGKGGRRLGDRHTEGRGLRIRLRWFSSVDGESLSEAPGGSETS